MQFSLWLLAAAGQPHFSSPEMDERFTGKLLYSNCSGLKNAGPVFFRDDSHNRCDISAWQLKTGSASPHPVCEASLASPLALCS